MIPTKLDSSWLEQPQAGSPPLNQVGELILDQRLEFPDFWRFQVSWPGAVAQLYHFVGQGRVPHESPCVGVAIVALEPELMTERMVGFANAKTDALVSMSSGHGLVQVLLQLRFENAADLNMWEAEPDVESPLRRAAKAYYDGSMVAHWEQFAREQNRSAIVYDTPTPQMHQRAAKANGFSFKTTPGGRTYWRKDL